MLITNLNKIITFASGIIVLSLRYYNIQVFLKNVYVCKGCLESSVRGVYLMVRLIEKLHLRMVKRFFDRILMYGSEKYRSVLFISIE